MSKLIIKIGETLGTQTTRNYTIQKEPFGFAGTLFGTRFPTFSTTLHVDLSSHRAKKQNSTESKNIRKCQPHIIDFTSFCSKRLHRQNVFGRKSWSQWKRTDFKYLVSKVNDKWMRVEVKLCKRFVVDFEKENERIRFFIYAMKLPKLQFWIQKLYPVFDSRKCAI